MAQTPLPPAPGVLELKASYLQNNQVLQNTYHLHKAGAWSPSEIAAAIDAFRTWEDTYGKLGRSELVSLNEVRGTDLSSPTANYAAIDITPAIQGSRSSQALPENVTWAIQAGTGTRGRGKQGRVFWVGLAEDQTNGSVMVSDRADEIIGYMNQLKTDLEAATAGTLVTLHRRQGNSYLNPATWTAIGVFGANDLTTDTQKNRLPNHKRHKRSTP